MQCGGNALLQNPGTPLIAGREFDERDAGGDYMAAVVNRAFAAKYFGTPNAVGRRIAMGAGPAVKPDTPIIGVTADSLSLVLERLLLATLPAALGLAAAYALSRFISTRLYGIQPLDPLAFSLATAALLAAAALAGFIPSWRASQIDPIRALRYE